MVSLRRLFMVLGSSLLILWLPVSYAADPGRYQQAFEQALAQRNLAQAIEVHKQMLTELPDEPATAVIGARIMTLQNNLAGAIAAYKNVLTKHPHQVDATLWLAQIEFNQQPDQAIQRIDAALKVYPRADNLRQLAASELLRLQRPQQALTYMQEWAAASDQSNGLVRYNELGKLYYQLKQPSQAADALRRALDFQFEPAIASSLVQLYEETERWGELQAIIVLLIDRTPKKNQAQITQQLAAQSARAQAKLFALNKPPKPSNPALTTALEAFMASYKAVNPLFSGVNDGSARWMLQRSDRVGLAAGTLAQDWRLANAALYFAEQGDLRSAYDAVSKLDDAAAKIIVPLRIAALLATQQEPAADYWLGFAAFNWHDLRQRGIRAAEGVSDFDRRMGAELPPIYSQSLRVGGIYHHTLLQHWPQHPIVHKGWSEAERADIARAYAAVHDYTQALKWLELGQFSPYELRDWIIAMMRQPKVDQTALVQLTQGILNWQRDAKQVHSSTLKHELNQTLLTLALELAAPFPALSEQILQQQQQLASTDAQRYALLETLVAVGQSDRAQALLTAISEADFRTRANELLTAPPIFSDLLKQRQFDQAMAYLRAGKPTELWEINFTAPLVMALIEQQDTAALRELLTQHQRVIDDEAQLQGWLALIEITASQGGDTVALVSDLENQQNHFTGFNDLKWTDIYFQTLSEMAHRYGSTEQRSKLAQRRYPQDSTRQAMLWGAVLAQRAR